MCLHEGNTGGTEEVGVSHAAVTWTENCNPPEPCRKISEALCLPAGETMQRRRCAEPDGAAMTAAWTQLRGPRPYAVLRDRARRRARGAPGDALAQRGCAALPLGEV